MIGFLKFYIPAFEITALPNIKSLITILKNTANIKIIVLYEFFPIK